MSYINPVQAGQFVQLDINAATTFATANLAFEATEVTAGNIMTVPALQDITVNGSPGTFRWRQLDNTSEYVITTPNTNSIAMNIVLDPTTFFDGSTGNTAGLFNIINDKTLVYFRMYWQGTDPGDRYIEGEGYLSGLAATVTPDAPVWVSPLEIQVVGGYTSGTV